MAADAVAEKYAVKAYYDYKELINKEQNGMFEDIDEIKKDILELYIKYFKKESVKTDKLATLKNEYIHRFLEKQKRFMNIFAKKHLTNCKLSV